MKPTVIIGMGPSGWAQVLELLKSGVTDITIIDKRDNPYQRFNSVALAPTAALKFIFERYTNFPQHGFALHPIPITKGKYSFFLQKKSNFIPSEDPLPPINPLDRDFFKYVKKNGCTITIPALQEYLRNKALELAAANQCKITELHSEVVKVDTNSEQPAVILKDSPAIAFRNLIIASGGSSFDIPIDAKRKRLPVPRTANKTNFAIQLKFDLKNTNEKIKNAIMREIHERAQIDPFSKGLEKINKKHMPVLAALGWSKKNLPTKFINYNSEKQSFYVVGECPDHIATLEEPKKSQAIAAWAKQILLLEYPQLDMIYASLGKAIDHINLDASQKNAASIVVAKPSYLLNPYVRLKNGQNIFHIGDKLLDPNYQFGHGIEFALRAAKAVAACFKKGEFQSEKSYKQLLPQLVYDYMKLNRIFNIMIKLKNVDLYDRALEITDSFYTTKAMLFKNIPTIPSIHLPKITPHKIGPKKQKPHPK